MTSLPQECRPLSGMATTTGTDLDDLAHKIDVHHQGAQVALKHCLDHILKAGQYLIEAKKAVGHGNWLPWLESHTGVSPRMAQNYMRITRGVAKLPEGKAKRVSHLSLRDAISTLASDTSRAASLPPALLDQATSDAKDQGRLSAALSAAKERARTAELLEQQNAVNHVTADLIHRRPPTPSELALAHALLRVIAEQAQANPDIQPHTVKIVFDMLSGLEEIWPLDPNGDYL